VIVLEKKKRYREKTEGRGGIEIFFGKGLIVDVDDIIIVCYSM
jgi:hypothetical protein